MRNFKNLAHCLSDIDGRLQASLAVSESHERTVAQVTSKHNRKNNPGNDYLFSLRGLHLYFLNL